MVCVHVRDLLSVPTRRSSDLVLLTSLPLTPRLASTNVTVRLVSQVSLNTGVPNTGVAGHWMVASAGQLVTVGGPVAITAVLQSPYNDVWRAPVAVQIRCVLLTSLPLTPRLASTNVTVRLVSHVSLNTGVRSEERRVGKMVASAGQLVTVGAELSMTVIV